MILKAEKKGVKECFTCPLCTSLFDRPTTISECLHSFCRICIHDKLLTQKLQACPICKVDLGVFPFDKLRADYSLESSMLKLFPPKQETVEATTETIEAFFKSSTKKEKSLSSILTSSATLSITPDLNLDAPLEPDMLDVKKLSEQVEAVPQIQRLSKPMKTFQKRQRENSEPKYFDNGLEIKFNIDLNIGLDNGLDEAGTSQGYIQMENNLEKDNEMIPRLPDLTNTPPVIVEPSTSQNVIVFGGDTKEVTGENSEECVEVVNHNKSVVNSVRETEVFTVEVNQNIILISSDGETEEDYGEKEKNNAEESQECATSNLGKVSTEKQKNDAEKNQEYATSSSGKSSVAKQKNNAEKNQECVIPISGKMSDKKQKQQMDYCPPILRPRKGRTVNLAASTSQAAITVEAEKKVVGKNNVVLTMSSIAGTSEAVIPVEVERKVVGRNIAVWFSLMASKNQNTDRPLPSIARLYLKVTNGNLSVSYVKKYLVKKLDLESEEEVEIWLRHEKVSSSMTLLNLVDRWMETIPSKERKNMMVGSSGAEFVMVLNYSRKETSELL